MSIKYLIDANLPPLYQDMIQLRTIEEISKNRQAIAYSTSVADR